MLLPKIVYNGTTLNFTFPPVQKPGADERQAEREDVKSSSGILQSITEHVEKFRTLQLDAVPLADMPAWEAFIDYAIEGNPFTYYPDATNAAVHDDWTLADTGFKPVLANRGYAKFSIKMRKVIA